MKYNYAVKKNGILYTPGMEVPGDKPVKVELTDDVPEGALETNKDGSVNAYDENGNVVGTVSAEELEKIQNEAATLHEEQTGKKVKK